MKIKSNKGFVGTDMAISLIALFAFSSIIISLMYSNFLENMRIKKQALATIYLTQTLENIAIADYEKVTEENTSIIVPPEALSKDYDIQLEIIEDLELTEEQSEDIIKKVVVTISYSLANKDYSYSIERMKIKE